ncbi:MAG: UDP-glucose/GDP-mannose dehydrogenase family protein [Candidatus Desulfofervidaceae bacterium]|nr:UDP-glucose/GDP-mannose dehydrogenase family protein [Candidatus Desulfofervidaceae bacterium]
MNVTIVGGGYVGLVTGACFAEIGNHVLIIEKIPEKVSLLKQGISPIYEPGLNELLEKNLKNSRLDFSTDIKKGIDFSEVIFICVGTPQSNDGAADLSQIEEVARHIAQYMDSYKLIVEKSTVPVNTHKLIKQTLKRYTKNDTLKFDIASNPEFLKEGSAVKDFMEPDRIVIGVESEKAKDILLELYNPFSCPKLVVDPATAEIIKHAANSFLAMKISFINMVADLCEKTGADVKLVAEGMGFDKRIGRSFLNAGIGYGGSCFPKDVKAFMNIGQKYGLDFSLLEEVEKINQKRPYKIIDFLKRALWTLVDKKIAVWGLSFKPDTDDVREAPSLKILPALIKEGAIVFAYDPKAMENFKRIFPHLENITYVNDLYEAIENAEALVILTEWEEFKNADFKKVKDLLKLPIIIDGRNIYEPKVMEDLGFEYYPIGRRKIVEYF